MFQIQKPRVLFLYVGGTMGQQLVEKDSETFYRPPHSADDFLKSAKRTLKNFKDRLKIDLDFSVYTARDSTNILPRDWSNLAFRIRDAQDLEGYDAVGIVHGTDTMHYTATALSFALHGCDPGSSGLRIPVVLTGSQIHLGSFRGDAEFNLANMFLTIEEAIRLGVADVLINFAYKIFLGCRTIKQSEKNFDAFASLVISSVGTIDASGVSIFPDFLKLKKAAKSQIELAPDFFEGQVEVLELRPGLNPRNLLENVVDQKIDILILKTLGEANVPTIGKFSLIPIIEEATKRNIPTLLTSPFIAGTALGTAYELGFLARKAGAIPTYDLSDVATYVKCLWIAGNGLASNIEEFHQVIRTNYVGEVTPPRLKTEHEKEGASSKMPVKLKQSA